MSVRTVVESVTEHECERCGRKARTSGSFIEGWGPIFTLFVSETAHTSPQPYFCPDCRASFQQWFNEVRTAFASLEDARDH